MKLYAIIKGCLVELDGYKRKRIWHFHVIEVILLIILSVLIGLSVVNFYMPPPPCHCTGVRTEQTGVIYPAEIKRNTISENSKIREK